MVKLHMLKSVTDTINTSLIFQSDSSLVVFDGGFPSEADYLHEYLLSLGGHVDAWFFTHIHDDHVSACFTILKKYRDIRVDRACYHFPSDEWLDKHDPVQGNQRTVDITAIMRDTFAASGTEIVTVEKDEVYAFDGFSIRILRTPDEAITGNPINNSSCVFRVEADSEKKSSLIILGDLGVEGGRQLLETNDPALIKADYCQMAHHGQSGVDRPVYEAIRPRFCLWCTPSWVWDNMGPGGYDTSGLRTVVVRGWMSDMRCVEKHYRMIDGDHVIEL